MNAGSNGNRARAHLAPAARILLGLLVVAALVGAAVLPALAQEGERRRQGLFDFLFGGRVERREERIEQPRPRQQTTTRRTRPAAPAEPPVPTVEKAADAKIVLVIGDFLGGGLAEGLDAAFADKANVRIVNRAKGSSGFVRQDVFDWPQGIGTIIDTDKPAVVVAMLGSNDRQQMRVGETREQKLSAGWTAEYEKRAKALAEAVKAKGVPLIWVGMPSFKVSSMTTDMLAFNAIYRDAAESAGAEFVDVWEGFVDANGAFVTTGPDITGQPVRLRGSDGINLTRAGKRKAAFYVEKPLNRLLGGALATPGAPGSPGAPAAPVEPTAPDVTKIVRTAPVSLADPELDGGTDLLGGTVEAAKREEPLPSELLTRDGISPAPTPGRADDFGGAPMRAARPMADKTDPEKTTAIRR